MYQKNTVVLLIIRQALLSKFRIYNGISQYLYGEHQWWCKHNLFSIPTYLVILIVVMYRSLKLDFWWPEINAKIGLKLPFFKFIKFHSVFSKLLFERSSIIAKMDKRNWFNFLPTYFYGYPKKPMFWVPDPSLILNKIGIQNIIVNNRWICTAERSSLYLH